MEVFRRWNFVADFYLWKKWQIWISEHSILGMLGTTHDLDWWLVGKPMVNFLFALTGLFPHIFRFRSYDAKSVQLSCFPKGSTSLHSNFTGTWSSPSTILGIRKLEKVDYPKVKNGSFCVPSFWHNKGVWRMDGRTDGRICRSIYSACKPSFAARCKKA